MENLRKIRATTILIIILCFQNITYAQVPLSAKTVDTEPIELYLQLVNSIRKSGKPDDQIAKKYFSHPIVTLFKQRPDFDSLKFINSLTSVYSSVPKVMAEADRSSDHELMLKYKANEAIIRKSIAKIKKTNISELVKKRLKPFFSPAFDIEVVSLQYTYLFIEEGNGGFPGHVFNSALQTAYLKYKDIDLISAHEAYHTVTNSIFMNKFKRVFEGAEGVGTAAVDSLANYQNLLWYLEIVAEEGVADLIDKPILSADNSPLTSAFKELQLTEKSRSEVKIRQLDSLLSNGKLSFLNMNSFLENGGHIPGRYMGLKIKNNDLLKDFVVDTGNPFKFIYLYNKAVKNDAAAPKFSSKSILYLKALEDRFISKE